jgi:hypothetical protein
MVCREFFESGPACPFPGLRFRTQLGHTAIQVSLIALDAVVGLYVLVAVENTKPSSKDIRPAVLGISRINILQRRGKMKRSAKPELSAFLPNELPEPPVGLVKGFDFVFSAFARTHFSSPKSLAADVDKIGIDTSSIGIE